MSTSSGSIGIESMDASDKIALINQQAHELMHSNVLPPSDSQPPPCFAGPQTPPANPDIETNPSNPSQHRTTPPLPGYPDATPHISSLRDRDQLFYPLPVNRITGQAFTAVETYGGDSRSTCMEWLTQLDRIADFYVLPDDARLRLAMAKLAGAADAWATANRHKLLTWAAFKTLFEKRFGEPRDVLVRQYSRISQQADETAQCFAERLAVLRDKLHLPHDDIAQSRFLEGLRGELQLAVAEHRCQSLDEAIDYAVYLESTSFQMWSKLK